MTRSHSEIARILSGIWRRGFPVTATLDHGEQLFIAQIMEVDVGAGSFVIGYGLSKGANSSLLASGRVALHADFEHSHVVWPASSPVDVVLEGQPGLRMAFPDNLLRHRQRAHPRVRKPPRMSVKCVVECPGTPPFELEIVDISLQGQGMLLSDPDIPLEPGTILKDCRILCPGRAPIIVDLELRHTTYLPQADGTLSPRVGCRFAASSADIADLVSLFTFDLDHPT